MKRALWILVTPLAIFLSLWLLVSNFLAPKIETWALNTLQSYSESSLPISIRAEKIQVRFLKPSLSLENIELTAKGELAPALKNMRIKSVRVFVDFLHLLSGRVTLSAVVIDSQ
jgi:translocation and assembly module TamB